MKKSIAILLQSVLLLFSCVQNPTASTSTKETKTGGLCEGCEAIYESPVPFEKLENMCWLPDWNESGTRLAVNGTVFNTDGSPVAGVIIYIYHTDQQGVYPKKRDEKGWAKHHGYIRGWMKTNEKGEYKFFTSKPASYPGSRNPGHIHVIIKGPGKNEYWIDDYLFDDDPYLTQEERKRLLNRGGSGIIKTIDSGNMLKAERDIYLGKNIPGYRN